MTDIPNVPEVPPPSSAKQTARFGARAVLAGVALALVAVPGALTLLLVEDRWAPLLRVDNGARDHLHNFAVTHKGFVSAMQLLSDSGSATTWQIVLGVVVVWLVWRRLPRLALLVVITAAGSSLLNTLVKSAVHRLRPVLTHPVAQEPGSSFPSGHAQAAIVGYAVLLLVFLPILHGVWRRVAVTLCGVGGGHGCCVQRVAGRAWTPAREREGGTRAGAGAASVGHSTRRRGTRQLAVEPCQARQGLERRLVKTACSQKLARTLFLAYPAPTTAAVRGAVVQQRVKNGCMTEIKAQASGASPQPGVLHPSKSETPTNAPDAQPRGLRSSQ